jgi:hypothetical protein
VDRIELGRLDGRALVDRLADDVEDAASVALPTGMVIGAPVSSTDMPRVRPSVEAMATVRTWLSPRCWATSSVSFCE